LMANILSSAIRNGMCVIGLAVSSFTVTIVVVVLDIEDYCSYLLLLLRIFRNYLSLI
jgi:hypothetical protein